MKRVAVRFRAGGNHRCGGIKVEFPFGLIVQRCAARRVPLKMPLTIVTQTEANVANVANVTPAEAALFARFEYARLVKQHLTERVEHYEQRFERHERQILLLQKEKAALRLQIAARRHLARKFPAAYGVSSSK